MWLGETTDMTASNFGGGEFQEFSIFKVSHNKLMFRLDDKGISLLC